MIVASRFHDVDLAAGGPRSIGVFHGHHPDGGPQPITFRDLGFDFDASVLDRCAELCVQPSRLYRRDDWIMLTFGRKTIQRLLLVPLVMLVTATQSDQVVPVHPFLVRSITELVVIRDSSWRVGLM